MDIRDAPFDPLYARMLEAFRGETEPWQAVSRAMRDAMVAHAVENSPYYAHLLEGRAPDRFDDIPVLTKELITGHHNELFAAGVPEDRRIHLNTSGSSGTPLAFVRDRSEGLLEDVSARRFLTWMQGVPLDATLVWISAGPPDMPGVHPMPAAKLTPGDIALEVQAWAKYDSYVLYGYSSAIHWIAGLVKGGMPLPKAPQACVGTGEMFTEPMQEHTSEALGCPVHGWYGAGEVSGYLAGTLPGSRRYACNPLLAWVEVVDDHGKPTAPGKQGRVVATDLNNWVFPFIRYETGDLATTSGKFAGGFPILETIDGRSSDLVTLASGRIISAVSFGSTVFVKHRLSGFVRAYQMAQTGPNSLEVRVIWHEKPTPALTERMEDAVRDIADADTTIHIRTVEELERTPAGKTWIVKRVY